MQFGGINYFAVLVAAAAGFGTGMAWYMIFGNAWMAALGKSKEELKPRPGPFIAAALCQLVMAIMLAGIMGHLGGGQITVKNGVLSGLLIWAGFVITTMIVNHAFQGAPRALTLIDGGHWLAVLTVMGIVIGLFGV